MMKLTTWLSNIIRIKAVIPADNKTLFTFYEQEKALQTTLMGLIERKKIQRFIKDNMTARKQLDSSMKELQQKFFKHDENGVMEITKPPMFSLNDKYGNKPDYEPKPILLNGYIMSDYEREFNDLMAQKVDLFF